MKDAHDLDAVLRRSVDEMLAEAADAPHPEPPQLRRSVFTPRAHLGHGDKLRDGALGRAKKPTSGLGQAPFDIPPTLSVEVLYSLW